ncbi:CLUMA_CG018465, isoform A [Clunio marinus]|uniref:CLUMA_CG018465, isoform A n=1 Tax=Clunio marinus TaxID=568069 RepID=A0A1J1IXV8_9DIPT|nr:CLUMA_CG018465, isoform A [Clunio marinus]
MPRLWMKLTVAKLAICLRLVLEVTIGVEVMMRAPGEVALHSKQLIDDNDNSKCDAAAND